MVNRSIQCFVEETQGRAHWEALCRAAGSPVTDFEAMLAYPDETTHRLLDALEQSARRPILEVLEDLGTFLVTNPKMDAVRRLMRFGGESFEEFLYSLDELNGRIGLALPDLELPQLELREYSSVAFGLYCTWERPGFGAVLAGVIRALADDYGTLAMLDLELLQNDGQVTEILRIDVLEASFSEGRAFSLAAGLNA